MFDFKYKCTGICERCFNEPKRYREPDGLDTPPYRYTEGCPYCGGEFVEQIAICSQCGYNIYEGDRYYEISSTGECFCEQCIEERR